MNNRNIIFMSMLFLVLPLWIGVVWVEILKIRGRWNQFFHAWVLGFVTMLTAAQLILVPLVALQQTLTTALRIWEIVLTALSVVSFSIILLRWKDRVVQGATAGTEKMLSADPGSRRWTWIFGVLAAVLILLQAYIPARYEHRDDDDSRFVAEEVSAVVHDTMYVDSPITADYMYWNEGEVRKDLTSPWAMYIAMNCKISNIPPAVLSHTYLPFFLVLICYAVYLLIGKALLNGNMEKTYLFLIFLSVINIWGYTSTHTLASMLLLRIWQGKAVCASLMLPVFFYVMYQILQKKYKKGWVAFLYVLSIASCLLSGIGIVTAPIVLFIYGVIDFIYYRKWRKTLAIFLAAVPCGIYLIYYLIG